MTIVYNMEGATACRNNMSHWSFSRP